MPWLMLTISTLVLPLQITALWGGQFAGGNSWDNFPHLIYEAAVLNACIVQHDTFYIFLCAVWHADMGDMYIRFVFITVKYISELKVWVCKVLYNADIHL